MTLTNPNQVFKVTTLFEVECLKNCAFWGQSYFRS